MTTKLVLRLLDAAGELLGWAEVPGVMKGDGNLTVEQSVMVPVEAVGIAAQLSIHWCDVNVEERLSMFPQRVTPGCVVPISAPWVAMRIGPPAGGLPPVTVREPVSVGIPVGSLGARAQ
jgi:hypothetical protein